MTNDQIPMTNRSIVIGHWCLVIGHFGNTVIPTFRFDTSLVPFLIRNFVLALSVSLALPWGALCADWKVGAPLELAAGNQVAQPHAAIGDGIYLVVWRNGYAGRGGAAQILAQRFDARTLQPLDKAPLEICAAEEVQEAPRAAYSDGRFLIVWQDFRDGKQYDIRGAVLDAKSGAVLRRDMPIAAGPDNDIHADVSATPSGFVVVWQQWRGKTGYGVSAQTLSKQGVLQATAALPLAEFGARPAVCSHGEKTLVVWVTGNHRGRLEGALLADDRSSTPLGVLCTACDQLPSVATSAVGVSIAVGSRTPNPDPWGWGGPGAVVCARVSHADQPLDQRHDYGYRMTHLSERKVPNVIDAASWGKTPRGKWDAGAVGGFPGTHDGQWPRGMAAVASVGHGEFVFAWVKGQLGDDRLTVSQSDIWIRALDGESLAETSPPRAAAASVDADELRPCLTACSATELLLLYEERSATGRRIAARRLPRYRSQ
jgi:hypothetical protein